MSSDLNIWLPADLSAPWQWSYGNVFGAAVDAADKAALASRDAQNVNVIIPGQNVRMFAHDLPKLREAERRAAAGFAIEDKLAMPLAGQHIVLSGGDDARVAVINRDKIQHITDALSQAGLQASGLFADFDVLPESSAAVLLPDRLIHPGALGYTLDREWAAGEHDETGFSGAMRSADMTTAINLLSGEFVPKTKMWLSPVQMGRIAALLLVTGTVWLGLLAAQNNSKIRQAEYLRAETARMYSGFTGQSAPANPALSVTRAVKSSGGAQADFLALSALLFRAVESVDGVTVESLQFDHTQNRLSLRLNYPRFESATDIEQAVENAGGVFNAGGIREQGGELIGDALLTPGGGS